MALWFALPLLAASCSLGLDPSLMTSTTSKALRDGGTGSVITVGASAPGDAAATASGVGCATDDDCASVTQATPCIGASTCDPTWHVCMLDVCDRGACALSSCDLASATCDPPTPMGFAISYFPVVSGGVGGFGPASAVAAAYPFLFVLTTNGVVAYDVFNPTTNLPPMTPLHGVPFIPTAIVASGRRVYFVSQVDGNGPVYRQAIAWIDVAGNPFVTSLEATTAWIETNEPTLGAALVDAQGNLVLVYADASDPTVTVSAPLADSTMLVPTPIASLAQDAGIVATSGSNLVAYRYARSASHPAFAVVAGAEQANGQATAEDVVTAFGPVEDQATFASGGDGTVLWESALARPDGGTVSAARLTWLASLADGGLDTSAHVDLQTYSPGVTGPVVGPAAWLDPQTALALAATADAPETTSVQVIDRTTGATVAGKRALIPTAPSALGLAVSEGFAYVLAQDDATNHTATVYVVATGCYAGESPPPPAEGGTTPPDAGPPSGDASADASGGGGAMPGTQFHALTN
jgi:hypothetical protein